MIQSAAYRCSKRVIDEAEGEGIDIPTKKHCVQPSGVPVVCRFLRSGIDEAARGSYQNKLVAIKKMPVSKPVTGGSIQNSPVKMPCPPPVRVGRFQNLPDVFMPRYKDFSKYVFREVPPEKKPSKPKRTQADEDAIMRRSAEVYHEGRREAEKRGYTNLEYQLCGGYLHKRKFESSPEPLSWEYRCFKMYLDQIRDTRGYGLTVSYSNVVDDTKPIILHDLVCTFHEWKRDPWTQQYVKKMEEMVLAKVVENMDKPYKCMRLVNLVMCNFINLVTFQVHEEGTVPADAQPQEIAEAYFTMPPISPILEHIQLHECKLRKGDKVLFSTVPMMGTPRV